MGKTKKSALALSALPHVVTGKKTEKDRGETCLVSFVIILLRSMVKVNSNLCSRMEMGLSGKTRVPSDVISFQRIGLNRCPLPPVSGALGVLGLSGRPGL
jgi:hypothetical protein